MIRVLLASRPKILSDIIKRLVECQPDMDLLGEVLDPIDLMFGAMAAPVDVVIVAPLEADGKSRICRHLLDKHPHLKIVTVSANGEAVCLYQSDCAMKRFTDTSWPSIFDIIRESVNPKKRRKNHDQSKPSLP